jgi:hypothetical protein
MPRRGVTREVMKLTVYSSSELNVWRCIRTCPICGLVKAKRSVMLSLIYGECLLLLEKRKKKGHYNALRMMRSTRFNLLKLTELGIWHVLYRTTMPEVVGRL